MNEGKFTQRTEKKAGDVRYSRYMYVIMNESMMSEMRGRDEEIHPSISLGVSCLRNWMHRRISQ